jgi:hypothetical protein
VQAVPTCGDTQPGIAGAQSHYCNPALGLAQNPNAQTYPNPSDSVSCAQFEVMMVLLDTSAYKSAATAAPNPVCYFTVSLAALHVLTAMFVQVCCVPLSRPTCGDFDITTPDLQPWPCPSATAVNPAAASASPPSNTKCCLVSACRHNMAYQAPQQL